MIRFIISLVMCLIFSTPCVAKTHHPSKAHQYAPLTLYDYIQASCRGQFCVESDELKHITAEVSNDTSTSQLDLLTLIAIESSFNTHASNTVNKGLMQVNMAFHKAELHPSNAFDARKNIEVGANIFAACMVKHHGNRDASLRCYNGGGDPRYVLRFRAARAIVVRLVDLQPEPT